MYDQLEFFFFWGEGRRGGIWFISEKPEVSFDNEIKVLKFEITVSVYLTF